MFENLQLFCSIYYKLMTLMVPLQYLQVNSNWAIFLHSVASFFFFLPISIILFLYM